VRGEPASVHYEMGRIWHCSALKDSEWETQTEQFPDGKNDDCPDTLFYCIEDLEHEPGGGMAGVVQHHGPKERRQAERDAVTANKPVATDALELAVQQLAYDGTPIPWEAFTQDDADRLDTLLAEPAAWFVVDDQGVRAQLCLAERQRRPAVLPSGV